MKTGIVMAAAFWGSVAAFGFWGWLGWCAGVAAAIAINDMKYRR